MTHAYGKEYLEKAQIALACMLDFAVYDLGYDIALFFDMFLLSGIAEAFGIGEAKYTVGRSGVELAYEVVRLVEDKECTTKPNYPANRSEEYWMGWALAYYQWFTSLSFKEIIAYIPIKQIQSLYSPYHEMDIRQFVDKMNELYREAKLDTNLKLLRKNVNLSQNDLATLSEVPVRTIQQYEQRQKSINKAQAETLFKLAKALHCRMEDILEKV